LPGALANQDLIRNRLPAWRPVSRLAAVLVFFLIGVAPRIGVAQAPRPVAPTQPVAPQPARPAPAPAQTQVQGQVASAPVVAPDYEGLVILIANTLIALNQANLTDNYSVLRELGAPDFQKTNTTRRLGEIFADMRARKLNFAPIVMFQPKFVRQPEIDARGFIRTTGFYETAPLQVHFDLVFQSVAGSWRLFEISVWTAVLRQ